LENVIFWDNFGNMVRKIIFYENHFIEFYQNQNDKVKSKIQYVFELIKQVERVPEKFLKHLEGTEGLFEVRVEFQSNIFSPDRYRDAALMKEGWWFSSTVFKRRLKRPQRMK
jgi:hypothetical protein